MRVGVIVICGILLFSLVNGYPSKCYKCIKNECECKRKILKATALDPPSFESTKQCEEINPTDLKPVKDVCSCVGVTHVRPHPRDADEPKFASSTSCECGYGESKPPPKKYPADVISQYLAALAAKRKTISETDLHYHGPPAKAAPSPKPVVAIPEELLHKLNRQPIELQPPKKKYAPRVESSEEEQSPCHPEKQYYSDICYGKIQPLNPTFEQLPQEEIPCQQTPDVEELSKEHGDTEEESDTEETPDESEEKEEEHPTPEEEDCSTNEDSSEELDDCDSCAEDEYKKRSIRLPVKPSNMRKKSEAEYLIVTFDWLDRAQDCTIRTVPQYPVSFAQPMRFVI